MSSVVIIVEQNFFVWGVEWNDMFIHLPCLISVVPADSNATNVTPEGLTQTLVVQSLMVALPLSGEPKVVISHCVGKQTVVLSRR